MKEDHTFWHKNIKREENSKSSDFWNAKKVWFQKNDDSRLGRRGNRRMTNADAEDFTRRINRHLKEREEEETRNKIMKADEEQLQKKFDLGATRRRAIYNF